MLAPHLRVEGEGPVGRCIGLGSQLALILVFAAAATGSALAAPPDGLTSVKVFGAVGDGVADDTAALQAAIASGQSLYIPPGQYRITASLRVTSPLNDGQTVRGAGSWGGPDAYNAATSAGATIIKPSAAVTRAVIIDGSPFPKGGRSRSWIQGFTLANLVIDMADMVDAPDSVAITQIQAWDGAYDHVRIIHDGTRKRAWLFKAGAYTTSLTNVQGGILDFEGASDGDGVTTITVDNPDIAQVIGTYVNGLKIRGGAIQCAACTSIFLRHASDIQIETDIETIAGGAGGFVYDLDRSDNFLFFRNALGGHVGPYMAGYPGQSFIDVDVRANFNQYPFNLTQGAITLNNQGSGLFYNRSSFLSGAADQPYGLVLGRTGVDAVWGVAAKANDYAPGAAPGDTVIGSTGPGERTLVMAAGNLARAYDARGHEMIGGYPAVTAGAGTARVDGNDSLFQLTAAANIRASTVAFSAGGAWAKTPVCVATGASPSAFPYIAAVSPTAITIGWSAPVSGATANVRCGLD